MTYEDIYKNVEAILRESRGTSKRFSKFYEPRMKRYEFWLPFYSKKRNKAFSRWLNIKQGIQKIIDVDSTFKSLGVSFFETLGYQDLVLDRLGFDHSDENIRYCEVLFKILPSLKLAEIEKNAFQIAVSEGFKGEDIRRLILYTVIGCDEHTVEDYRDLPFSYLCAVIEVLYSL